MINGRTFYRRNDGLSVVNASLFYDTKVCYPIVDLVNDCMGKEEGDSLRMYVYDADTLFVSVPMDVSLDVIRNCLAGSLDRYIDVDKDREAVDLEAGNAVVSRISDPHIKEYVDAFLETRGYKTETIEPADGGSPREIRLVSNTQI